MPTSATKLPLENTTQRLEWARSTLFLDAPLFPGFKQSIVIHAVVVLAILGAMSVGLWKEPKIIVPALRVDIVGLPDRKIVDLAPPAEEPQKVPEVRNTKPTPPVDDKVISLKESPKKEPTKKNQLKSAIDRIKALSSIEESTETRKKQTPTKYLGNKLSAGTSTSGDATEDGDAYLGNMRDKLQANWNLPLWLSKQDLRATLNLILDRSGNIQQLRVATSSGNPQFDDYCLKTVRQSAPFSRPPDNWVGEVIQLGFPL